VEKYKVGSNEHMYADAPTITARQDEELRKQLKSGFKFVLKEEHRYTGIAAKLSTPWKRAHRRVFSAT